MWGTFVNKLKAASVWGAASFLLDRHAMCGRSRLFDISYFVRRQVWLLQITPPMMQPESFSVLGSVSSILPV